jgi:carbon monoxide dehydrogenase subunit G
MAIKIQETFQVKAPIDAVWQFMMTPEKVVTCMPGAGLDEVVDERTFLGNVKVKVGAVTSSYKGRVQLTEVDEQGHVVQMVAEGRETGGGLAKGTLSGRLRSLPDGGTEAVVEASVDLTGRIMQVGRGMIQGVAQQLFKQFVSRTQERLEAAEGAEGPQAASQPAVGKSDGEEAIRILPLILGAIWAAIVRLFRRLLGRPVS